MMALLLQLCVFFFMLPHGQADCAADSFRPSEGFAMLQKGRLASATITFHDGEANTKAMPQVKINATADAEANVAFDAKHSINSYIADIKGECGDAPQLGGSSLDTLISGATGVLLIAIKDMRCTAAVETALAAAGIQYDAKYFESTTGEIGGDIPSDGSEVWKWLHCTYPQDNNMHSYVFKDGEFLGDGNTAAAKIQSGALGGKDCEESFADQAAVVNNFQQETKNRVLLFGWQGCPCTGIAEERLAASSACYDGRTWADQNSALMKYLQCKSGDPNHHSFVYFRSGSEADSSWDFYGTGFDLASDKIDDSKLSEKLAKANADTSCKQESVAFNVYGGPLEECRLPGDEEGGSWMDDGKCKETTGGIHQICIQAGTLPHDFSMNTYQASDWSESRTNSSHCICVGAWSTYMTEEEKHPEQTAKITPRCKSIPETVLSKEYLGHWKEWNGFVANVAKGLSELVERCLTIDDSSLKCGLKERFAKLKDEEDLVKTASELKSVREKIDALSC